MSNVVPTTPSFSRFGGKRPTFMDQDSAKQGVIFISSLLSLLAASFAVADGTVDAFDAAADASLDDCSGITDEFDP